MNDAHRPDEAPETLAADWLAQLEAAFRQHDAAAAAALFLADGHWRDLLAFDLQLATTSGTPAITARLATTLARTRPRALHLPPARTRPHWVTRAGTDTLEVIFAFETAAGPANGVARLVATPEGLRAWILLTALDGLHGHPELGPQSGGAETSRQFGGENWLDRRTSRTAYADRDPAVIVVGAGQAGLSVAARLGQLGVDTLIIDREARVGDNWRHRYHSLTLHNEVHVNHLPYMPFPPTWPVFIPKDKLAGWFEAYAEAMELNVWTGTALTAGSHDAASGRWAVTLQRMDGSTRTMHPRHLIFATGVSSIPIQPDIPGLADFAGTVQHSGHYTSGAAWRGRPAVVLGTGNSGHDVAQDLHASGAAVTIVQRSPTHIVSLAEAQRVYALYAEGMPTDDCDLLATAMPFPALKRAYQLATAHSAAADKPLLDRLAARGFRLDPGIDGTGFQMLYLQRGGGYYFNVGCSDLIADGAIGLIQAADLDRVVPEGLRLRDGRVIPAELLVLATGYRNQQDVVRAYLGDAIAERIGPVWGFDAGGELRNMWRPTPQPGLWFTAGSLAQCRIYSKYLALQIKAQELALG